MCCVEVSKGFLLWARGMGILVHLQRIYCGQEGMQDSCGGVVGNLELCSRGS